MPFHILQGNAPVYAFVVHLHYLIQYEEIHERKACSKIATILLLGEKSFHQQLMIILVTNS